MEVYILKSAACLVIMFTFYKLVLEQTALHTTKRYFLLGSLVAAIIIPYITFTQTVYVAPVATQFINEITTLSNQEVLVAETPTNYTPYIVWSIYSLGVVIFGFRFARNLYRITKKVQKNPTIKEHAILYVLMHLPVTPHSFFNYIFLSKKAYETNTIPKEVIAHERAHVDQKHSWDIILIELLCVVFWFNPFLYFIKNSIKLNHEFLADRTVLQQGATLSAYQKILLDYSSSSSVPEMAHAINYSSSGLSKLFTKNSFGLVKKRFTVMKTHTSKRAAWLKGLLILPLMVVLVYGFSATKIEERIATTPEVLFENPEVQAEYETWYHNTLNELSNKKVTPQQIQQYNKLASFWNTQFEKDPTNRVMPLSELKKLETIYRSMTVAQRNVAQPFPDCGIKESNTTSIPTARSIDIKIKANGTYLVEGTSATKNTLAKTVGKLHQDLTPAIRNHMMNIHITKPKDPSREEVQFIFDALKEYGFYRLVAGNQEVVRGKGNTPLASKSALTKKEKPFLIIVQMSEITINGKLSSLKTFASDINKLTKNWEETDYTDTLPIIKIASTPKDFLKRLDAEYKKTHFSKANGGLSLVPPPPPSPDAPKVYKGSNDGSIPPPPPPPPALNMEKLANQGAIFYYEGKQISSEKAIKLVKKNKNINVQVRKNKSGAPSVIIQKAPFDLKKSTGVNLKTGNIKINGKDHFYATKNGVTSYFDRFGNAVDKNGNNLASQTNKNPTFYLNGKEISSAKANKLLKNNKSIAVATEDDTDGKYIIRLTDLSKNSNDWSNPNSTNNNSNNINHNANNNPNSTIDLTDVIEKGATFYLNDKKISTKQAKRLAANTNETIRVNVKNTKSGNPSVYFWTE